MEDNPCVYQKGRSVLLFVEFCNFRRSSLKPNIAISNLVFCTKLDFFCQNSISVLFKYEMTELYPGSYKTAFFTALKIVRPVNEKHWCLMGVGFFFCLRGDVCVFVGLFGF